MSKKAARTKQASPGAVVNLKEVSQPTGRKELHWLKGERKELEVYRIPSRLLYFNIENGRYADKMIQLRVDHPGVHIDPREHKWKDKILEMLKGEYLGTEGDREPFKKLREDILAKQQLRPGVVLNDGGVLDGNRRLAVLLDLGKTEQNPSRFEYFEGVILPKDIGPEDRWRIEAGLQIGRDEKLAYSPINQLLKIKEGLTLFRASQNPEKEISRALYGVPENEIKKDVLKVGLIDEYLKCIKRPDAYNEVGRLIERFEEAVNALENAKKAQWSPDRVQRLKLSLFSVIRDQTMDNWQMRGIVAAVSGKGKLAGDETQKALDDFLKLDCNPQALQDALAKKGSESPVAQLHKQKAQDFLDRMDTLKQANEPLRLATRAETSLKALLNALKTGAIVKHAASQQKIRLLPGVLESVIKVATKCAEEAKRLQGKRRTFTARQKRTTE